MFALPSCWQELISSHRLMEGVTGRDESESGCTPEFCSEMHSFCENKRSTLYIPASTESANQGAMSLHVRQLQSVKFPTFRRDFQFASVCICIYIYINLERERMSRLSFSHILKNSVNFIEATMAQAALHQLHDSISSPDQARQYLNGTCFGFHHLCSSQQRTNTHAAAWKFTHGLLGK